MHIGWNRIWKVLLGCACVIGSIVLLACGQVGWGIAALEAAVLLLALQYAPRAARLRKTWWFVELVLVLAVTVGYAGFAAVRAAQTPASAVVITTERSVPPVTPVPETAAPELTATPEPTPAPDTAEATCVASRKAKKYHRPSCQYAAKIKDENLVTFDSAAQAQAAGYAPCGACKPQQKPRSRVSGARFCRLEITCADPGRAGSARTDPEPAHARRARRPRPRRSGGR